MTTMTRRAALGAVPALSAIPAIGSGATSSPEGDERRIDYHIECLKALQEKRFGHIVSWDVIHIAEPAYGAGSIVMLSGRSMPAVIPAPIRPDSIASLIKQLQSVQEELKATGEREDELEADLPNPCVVNYIEKVDGKEIPRYAFTAAEIESHWKVFVSFYGAKCRAHVDQRLSELEQVQNERKRLADACGLTALLDYREGLWEKHDQIYDRLLAAKPSSLDEARTKIQGLGRELVDRLCSYEERDDVAAILAALI